MLATLVYDVHFAALITLLRSLIACCVFAFSLYLNSHSWRGEALPCISSQSLSVDTLVLYAHDKHELKKYFLNNE